MPRTWLALSFTCLTTIATAQEPTGHPAVDSAAVARAAWREAARTEDRQEAYRAVTRAVRAWPTQPAYVQGQARLAARLSDDGTLVAALRSLAAMEAGAGLAADTAIVRRAAANPAVAYARDDLIHATGARRRSAIYATLADSTIFAEGLTADSATGRLFVASVRHRTIYEVSSHGVIRDLDVARHALVGAILGVRFDKAQGVLWATTAGLPQMRDFTPGDTAIAALLRIRIADGTIERRWDLPPEPAGHTAGDLAIAPTGDVWVSDSRAPVLYRLRPGADSLERLTHPLFRSLQGIAPATHGQLYVADYSHGLLWVNPSSGAVLRLADAPGTTSLGLDGITLYRNDIIGVQNGVTPPRIVRFTLNPARTGIASATVIDRTLPEADEPTIGTLVGDDFLYVANSQWEKYDEAGRRVAGTALAPTMVRRLALDHQPEPRPGGHGMMAALWALAIAPPSLLLARTDSADLPPDSVPPRGVRKFDHVAVYLTGGHSDPPIHGLTYAHRWEAMYRGFFAELHVENLQLAERVELVTSRFGYFVTPNPPQLQAAGGVTLGYRGAHGGDIPSTVEIGLPLIFGTARWMGRWEAVYGFSSLGVTWGLRFQMETRAVGTPFVGGASMDLRALRPGEKPSLTLSFLLGVRAGPSRDAKPKNPSVRRGG